MKKKLKILALIHKHLVPPKRVNGLDLEIMKWKTEHHVLTALNKLGHEVLIQEVESDLDVIGNAKSKFNPDIALNLLEAFDYEAVFDHNIVSYLELLKLPYTGCNPRGLVITRDKALSKKLIFYHNIKTPQFAVAIRGQKFKKPRGLEFPLIVKSLIEEGSTGISQKSIVNNDIDLQERIEFIHDKTWSDAIVESFIKGSDLYVSLIGNNKIRVFPLLELVFENVPQGFHSIATKRVKWSSDYQKKYKIDLKQPSISDELKRKIEETSKKIYKILCLSGYARFDLRLSEGGEVYFIEANPNPDIADGEEFALSAKKGGVQYHELINKILYIGLNWNPEEKYR